MWLLKTSHGSNHVSYTFVLTQTHSQRKRCYSLSLIKFTENCTSREFIVCQQQCQLPEHSQSIHNSPCVRRTGKPKRILQLTNLVRCRFPRAKLYCSHAMPHHRIGDIVERKPIQHRRALAAVRINNASRSRVRAHHYFVCFISWSSSSFVCVRFENNNVKASPVCISRTNTHSSVQQQLNR